MLSDRRVKREGKGVTYNRHIGLALLPSKKGFKCLGLSILNLGYSKVVEIVQREGEIKVIFGYLDVGTLIGSI